MNDISLIRNWHERAKEDYFSRYVFEYLAFESFLKKFKYSESEILNVSGNTKERSYIQRMKNDVNYKSSWSNLLSHNADLKTKTNELILFLKNEPITTGGKWWNCKDYNCENRTEERGEITDETDFINIIEFWYQVRNNLFHANKNPDSKRDEILVRYAQQTLSVFVGAILLPEIESQSFRPAMWEKFEDRFFDGKAEVALGVGGQKGVANVYELLYLDDSYYPIILEDKKIGKDYIIEKLSFNLICLVGDSFLLKKKWENIKSRAKNKADLKKLDTYFKAIIPLLRDSLGDLGIE